MGIKLLIVDDDKTVVHGYLKGIEEWNEECENSQSKIEASVAISAKEAHLSLKEHDFDAAIIDIRLDNADKNKTEGNEVLDIIYEKIRFPTYVLSSNIGELNEKYRNNHFISRFARDSIRFEDVLKLIEKRYLTGITHILGHRGRLEEALAIVFWHHLPTAINYWEDADLDSKVKQKQLLRYTLSHLQEILSIDDDGGNDKRNRAEIYIYPPINASPTSGLIVKDQDGHYALVVTPSCDIAQDRADYIQLIEIVNLLERNDILSKESDTKRIQLIEKYVSNRKGDRYHFLPHYDELKPGILDFQRISNIQKDKFDELYQPICSISPFFYKDIVSRFASYYARQGSPDFDWGLVSGEINDLFLNS